MDVKISEILALIAVMFYSVATLIPDILNRISGKSKQADKK